MRKRTSVYIAIGSNCDPLEHIPRCLRMLEEIPRSALLAQSSWYRTLPWGIEDQPEFVNLAVGMDTALSPHSLLLQTQAIEARLGRERGAKNGPRTIDLDILLFGDLTLSDDGISIPHPGLLLRDFMLVPLIEIAPDARHPARCQPLRALQGELRYRQIVELVSPPPELR
jgi:2-amino-4-hydroxy-6-hydroxymethyldihydropteridine diphosphokinase